MTLLSGQQVICCLHNICQVSYLIVDGMYEELPEMMKDQYWDNEEFQLPYTGASQQFQKEEHVGSAAKIE
jgi:hypothetical protein